MNAVKTALWQCEFAKWSNGVTVNFGKLIGSPEFYPSSYILFNAMPHKVLHNELTLRFNSWMCQVVNSFKKKTA